MRALPPNLVDFDIEPSLFVRKVDNCGKEKVFLATTFAGYIFSKKLLSKTLYLKHSFSWDTVKRISGSNSTSVCLFYHGSEFKFSHEDAPSMLQSIITNIKSIFAPFELPILALDESFPLQNMNLQFPMVSRF